MLKTPSTSEQWRHQCLKRYGSFTLAYATLTDPQLTIFENPLGYIAYRRHWGYTFVLGDPVCDPSCISEMLSEFLQQQPGSAFCQVSRQTAHELQELGYWVNEMGVDTTLNLSSYDFRGSKRAGLRYANNWLHNHGYRIEEVQINAALQAEMSNVEQQWKLMRTRKKDVVFLNRLAVFEDEEDVRKFALFNGAGQLDSYVFFDPLYRGGEVIGYVTSIKRRRPRSPAYAELGICKAAIEQFQVEGKQILRLGLSPLADIQDRDFRHIRPLHHTLRYLHRARWVNSIFYNFLGHLQFKRRFGGVEERTYFATPSYFNDVRIIAWLRMMQIL